MRKLVGLVVVLAAASGVAADVLWDNNVVPNERGGRAISPPAFPNIRVADDFVVPDEHVWLIESVPYNADEDANWQWNDGDGIEVFIYADTAGDGPGKLIAKRTPGGRKMATGKTMFGRANFDY